MSVQAMAWVFEHSASTVGARLVLLAVANHADKFGQNAWGSVQTYAAEARLSERQARYALRKLEQMGEIREVGQSEWGTHVYEMPGMEGAISAPWGRQSSTARGAISDTSGGQPIAPEPSLEPPSKPSLGSLSFDRFYETFPRHQGKGAAKKAWDKALSKVPDANVLLIAAARYRDDPNRDPEFTCLPATWLNQERWSDEPLPSRNGRRYEGTLDRMAHDLMKGVNGDYRTNEGPGYSTVRSLPR
jgi:hypothetical protein